MGIRLVINRLVTCLPDPEPYQEFMISRLLGVHHYDRRVGDQTIALEVEIQDVEVVPEGIGAIQFCVDSGVIKPEDDIFAAFDIGRNTSIATLGEITEDGFKILSRRPCEAGGLQRLLVSLSEDSDFQKLAGGVPNLGLIHDGIVSGDYMYGKRGCFKEIYDRHDVLWLRSIKNPAFKVWEASPFAWLPRLGKTLFMGGAAPISRIWVENEEINDDRFFEIAPDPQMANVRGMLSGASSDEKVVAIDCGSGWVKIAASNGETFKVRSLYARVYGEPKKGKIDTESCYINYKNGPTEPFQIVLGESASNVSSLPEETVNEEKGLIAHQLVLAAIAPGLISATSNKTTQLRPRGGNRAVG